MSALHKNNKNKAQQSSKQEFRGKSNDSSSSDAQKGQIQINGSKSNQNFTEDKFKKMRTEHLQVAKKYAQKYESSSEEEGDLECETIIKSVFKSYYGDDSQLQKTQEYLENILSSGASTCLICIGNVKRSDYVSCLNSPIICRRPTSNFILLFILS